MDTERSLLEVGREHQQRSQSQPQVQSAAELQAWQTLQQQFNRAVVAAQGPQPLLQPPAQPPPPVQPQPRPQPPPPAQPAQPPQKTNGDSDVLAQLAAHYEAHIEHVTAVKLLLGRSNPQLLAEWQRGADEFKFLMRRVHGAVRQLVLPAPSFALALAPPQPAASFNTDYRRTYSGVRQRSRSPPPRRQPARSSPGRRARSPVQAKRWSSPERSLSLPVRQAAEKLSRVVAWLQRADYWFLLDSLKGVPGEAEQLGIIRRVEGCDQQPRDVKEYIRMLCADARPPAALNALDVLQQRVRDRIDALCRDRAELQPQHFDTSVVSYMQRHFAPDRQLAVLEDMANSLKMQSHVRNPPAWLMRMCVQNKEADDLLKKQQQAQHPQPHAGRGGGQLLLRN